MVICKFHVHDFSFRLNLCLDPYVLDRAPLLDQTTLSLLSSKYYLDSVLPLRASAVSVRTWPDALVRGHSNSMKHLNVLLRELVERPESVYLTFSPLASPDDLRERYLSPIEWDSIRCIEPKLKGLLDVYCPVECCAPRSR